MSFWSSLKPAPPPPPTASEISLSPDGRLVQLVWTDGSRTAVTARLLRQSCPCAGCVEEWTGRRTLDPDSVPSELTVKDIAPVGTYALAFTFGDGHQTGIYEWKTLRRLSEPPAAAPERRTG